MDLFIKLTLSNHTLRCVSVFSYLRDENFFKPFFLAQHTAIYYFLLPSFHLPLFLAYFDPSVYFTDNLEDSHLEKLFSLENSFSLCIVTCHVHPPFFHSSIVSLLDVTPKRHVVHNQAVCPFLKGIITYPSVPFNSLLSAISLIPASLSLSSDSALRFFHSDSVRVLSSLSTLLLSSSSQSVPLPVVFTL